LKSEVALFREEPHKLKLRILRQPLNGYCFLHDSRVDGALPVCLSSSENERDVSWEAAEDSATHPSESEGRVLCERGKCFEAFPVSLNHLLGLETKK
jgi:hypothetical protein